MTVIIEDTRQQLGKHTAKNDAWAAMGLRVVRSKLVVGDYMLVGGTVSVDTKKDVLELCMDVDQQHERFRGELMLARDCGIQLIVLVENEDGVADLETLSRWKNPRAAINRRKGLRPPISGARLARACKTMGQRYGVRFEFCRPEDAGARVIELLEGGNGS